MEVMDLTDALSEVALQFCKGSLRYLEHLSIHGSISLITDTSTNIGFFTRKIPEKNNAETEPGEVGALGYLEWSHTTNISTTAGTEQDKMAAKTRVFTAEDTYTIIPTCGSLQSREDVGSEIFASSLSEVVATFCEANLEYTGNAGLHGNLTIVADTNTSVTFFSKKLAAVNRNLRKEEVIDMKTEISKSCQEEVRPRTDNQLPQTFYEKSLEVGEGPSAEQGEVQERIFWHVQDLNFPEHGHPNSIGAGDCWSEREGEQGSYFLADEASQKPVVFSSLSDTGMVGCQRIKQEPDDHDQVEGLDENALDEPQDTSLRTFMSWRERIMMGIDEMYGQENCGENENVAHGETNSHGTVSPLRASLHEDTVVWMATSSKKAHTKVYPVRLSAPLSQDEQSTLEERSVRRSSRLGSTDTEKSTSKRHVKPKLDNNSLPKIPGHYRQFTKDTKREVAELSAIFGLRNIGKHFGIPRSTLSDWRKYIKNVPESPHSNKHLVETRNEKEERTEDNDEICDIAKYFILRKSAKPGLAGLDNDNESSLPPTQEGYFNDTAEEDTPETIGMGESDTVEEHAPPRKRHKRDPGYPKRVWSARSAARAAAVPLASLPKYPVHYKQYTVEMKGRVAEHSALYGLRPVANHFGIPRSTLSDWRKYIQSSSTSQDYTSQEKYMLDHTVEIKKELEENDEVDDVQDANGDLLGINSLLPDHTELDNDASSTPTQKHCLDNPTEESLPLFGAMEEDDSGSGRHPKVGYGYPKRGASRVPLSFIPKSPIHYKQYTKDMKREVAEHAVIYGLRPVANHFGIPRSTVCDWKRLITDVSLLGSNKYPDQMKRAALEQAEISGLRGAAERLGIPRSTLADWKRRIKHSHHSKKYSMELKREALEHVESHGLCRVASHFGIPRSTLSNWKSSTSSDIISSCT